MTVTQQLREWAARCDFAAVILTSDDIVTGRNSRPSAGRDNCLFEAGFLAGAFGDFERCFLLTNADQHALPSDLLGLQHFPFKESDLEQFRDQVREGVTRIATLVESKGLLDRPIVPVISKDRLMELERSASSGGNLTLGSVVVSSSEFLERDYLFARTVLENLNMGSNYAYFLPPDRIVARGICETLQVLCLANLLEPSSTATAFEARFEIMKENVDQVRKNLELIRNEVSMNFLPHEAPFEFRLHNAESEREAKCYVRYSTDDFIELHKGNPSMATATARDLLRQCILDQEEVVFRSTQGFALKAPENKPLLDNLRRGIERYFVPELRDQTKEVCGI
jgi:hypothetical protein